MPERRWMLGRVRGRILETCSSSKAPVARLRRTAVVWRSATRRYGPELLQMSLVARGRSRKTREPMAGVAAVVEAAAAAARRARAAR